MKLSLKIVGLNNHLLKLISLIFGYLFWLVLSRAQIISSSLEIPVCFYDLKENLEIVAPEAVKIQICAKRSDLNNAQILNSISAHFDASKIKEVGENKIELNENDIFLHDKTKLVEYNPSIISIQVKEKK